MKDIHENEFRDAVKNAVDRNDLEFFEGFDTSRPPTEAFARAGAADARTETNDGANSRAARRNTKTRQRRLFSGLAVAACFVFVVGIVLTNGLLSQNGTDSQVLAPPDVGDASAEAVEWSTAGTDYTDLYQEIRNYYSESEGGSMDLSLGVAGASGGAMMPLEEVAESAPVDGAGDGSGADVPINAPVPDTAGSPPNYAAETPPAAQDSVAGGAGNAEIGNAETERDDAVNAPESPAGAPAFSDTNNQVEGVQEADVVKTDGIWIYAVNSANLVIAKANDGQPEVVSRIPQVLDQGQAYFEMYIVGDRLVAVRQGYNPEALRRIEEERNQYGYSGYEVAPGGNAGSSLGSAGTAGSTGGAGNVGSTGSGDASGAGTAGSTGSGTVGSSGGAGSASGPGTAGSSGGAAQSPAAASCIVYPTPMYQVDTAVDIFDVSDRGNPRLLHTLSQSGTYRDSRMADGVLYLISNYTEVNWAAADPDDPRTYVPLYAEDEEQITAQPEDIVIWPDTSWPSYTNISGIDAAGSGTFVSQKSVFGSADIVYATTSDIYLTATKYVSDKTKEDEKYNYYVSRDETTVTRVAMNGGAVDVAASAKIPGRVNNQFSIDVYGGALRVVVTDSRNAWADFREAPQTYSEEYWRDFPVGNSKITNALYTLDSSLNMLGSVTDLAEGETVYSCRFMGDVAYFVTFRQTDPLFSVDVSDPASPKVLGALKIPGFSEYLHPFGAGQLFGLGKDADETTGISGNLKLSMFDNSDPASVSEKHKLIIEGHLYSAAEYNHKAILVSAERGLIAFPAGDGYLVYSYDADSGFSKIAEARVDSADYSGQANAYAGAIELRGLFIDDVFYVVSPNSINAYDMANEFAPLGSAALNEGVFAWSVSEWDYDSGYGGGVVMPLGNGDMMPAVDVIE